MFTLNKNTPFTKEILGSYLNDFVQNKQPRLKKLKEYYMGKNAIHSKKNGVESPQNKISHAFAAKITDTQVSYFMGSPVSYSSEDSSAATAIKLISDKNDEEAQNLRLAQDASIYGIAYELVYINENKDIRYKDIDPRYSFVIYDDTLEQNPLYFIRFYNNDVLQNWTIEVYDNTHRSTFKTKGLNVVGGILQDVGEPVIHGFKQTPVAVYMNNRYRTGDYEKTIDMIDAYDSIASNTLNDLENFADAYLVFRNVDIDEDDMRNMRESRIISFNDTDGEGEIFWLTKDVLEGGAWDGTQAKLEEQIFVLTSTPNFQDKNFSGNSSGVALKYKLLPLEQKAASKETEFRKGLYRRIDLIEEFMSLTDLSISNFEITFKRTLPVDVLNEMQALQAGYGILPDEVLFSQVSFIDNPSEVAAMKEKDSTLDFDNFE